MTALAHSPSVSIEKWQVSAPPLTPLPSENTLPGLYPALQDKQGFSHCHWRGKISSYMLSSPADCLTPSFSVRLNFLIEEPRAPALAATFSGGGPAGLLSESSRGCLSRLSRGGSPAGLPPDALGRVPRMWSQGSVCDLPKPRGLRSIN